MNEIEVCVAESGISGGVSKACLRGAEGWGADTAGP